jgi:hypothetical protein
VVAENRVNSGWCLKLRKELSDRLGRLESPTHDTVDDIIARQENQVRRGLLSSRDHLGEFRKAVERRSHVKVCEHRDTEARALWGPMRNRQLVIFVAEARGFKPERPEARGSG